MIRQLTCLTKIGSRSIVIDISAIPETQEYPNDHQQLQDVNAHHGPVSGAHSSNGTRHLSACSTSEIQGGKKQTCKSCDGSSQAGCYWGGHTIEDEDDQGEECE